jgi:hypothetical protein
VVPSLFGLQFLLWLMEPSLDFGRYTRSTLVAQIPLAEGGVVDLLLELAPGYAWSDFVFKALSLL